MTTDDPPATVLTVCTGNICRSPAMEFYLERAWGDEAVVSSAGTTGAIGWHIPAPMRAAEEGVGLVVPEHEPRQLELDEIERTDLVLVAANGHRDWIARHVGAVPVNTFLLTEASALAARARRPAGTNLSDRIRTAAALLDEERARDPEARFPDVDDPYLHGDEAYVRAMAEIAEHLDVLIAWIG